MREQAVATNNKKNVYVLLCAVGMVVISLLRGAVGMFQWVFDLGVLACVGGFLYLYVRFFVTSFIYELEGGNFRIYKKTGRKEQVVCDIPLRNVMSVTLGDEPQFTKEGVVPKDLNYCASLGAEKPCVLVAYLDADYIDRIAIECSETFYKLLKIRQQRYCTGEPKFNQKEK